LLKCILIDFLTQYISKLSKFLTSLLINYIEVAILHEQLLAITTFYSIDL